MLEIQPVLPSFPVVKSQKIKRDDHSPEKRRNEKKHQTEKQDADHVQHIDEIV